MSRTLSKRQAEQRTLALLWLFINSKGMAQEFTEFCRDRKGLSLQDIERELKETTTNQK